MAVEMPISNRTADARADMPSLDAARTRLRRSSLKARVILRPIKAPVGVMESGFRSKGNPQLDSAFNGHALAFGLPALEILGLPLFGRGWEVGCNGAASSFRGAYLWQTRGPIDALVREMQLRRPVLLC